MPEKFSAQTLSFSPKTGTGEEKFSSLNRQYLQFIKSLIKPYSKYIIGVFIASIPYAGLGTVLPWAFNRVVAIYSGQAPLSRILMWLGIGVGAVVLKSLLEVLNKYILAILHTNITNDLRAHLYERIQKTSLFLHMQQQTGLLTNIVCNDSQAACSGVLEIFSALWQAPISALFLLATMFYFSPLISLLALFLMPVMSIVVTYFGNKARKAEKDYLQQEGSMLGNMVESLINVKQVKSFGLENRQKDRVEAYGEKLLYFRKRAVLLKSIVSPVGELLTISIVTAMAVVAYYQLLHGKTTTADIVGCLAAAFALRSPVKILSSSLVGIQKSVAAMQRIIWCCGDQEGQEALQFEAPANVVSLSFEDVSFAYDGKNKIFLDVSFTVSRGERIAILGHSGAGKTTLLDLLLGFYPCTTGNIEINNNQKLADMNLESWRKRIGIVTQEPFLFDGTIEENIRYGYQDANQSQVLEAAELAGCSEILNRLPGGILAEVGERGSRLSGGERKRIALARALIRPISVLVLDEATSELDPLIEGDILKSIDRIAGDLLVIHVSHRLSVLNHCDRAFLIKNGRLRECSFDEINSSFHDVAGRRMKGF
jgi:ATP-binding cassette, subfamily B, bacterial MsbA